MLAERVQQWYAEREQVGRQKGMQQGEARILIRQLTRRFGALSAEYLAKIQQADADTLLDWSERLLDAQSLAAVFGDAEQPPAA